MCDEDVINAPVRKSDLREAKMTSVQLAKMEIINKLDHLKLDLIWWDSGNWMMDKTDQAIGRSKKVGLSLMIILLGN